jgi:hypothetical protein
LFKAQNSDIAKNPKTGSQLSDSAEQDATQKAFRFCPAICQNRSVPRRFLPRMARMARIMALQKAVRKVSIREIREIRG